MSRIRKNSAILLTEITIKLDIFIVETWCFKEHLLCVGLAIEGTEKRKKIGKAKMFIYMTYLKIFLNGNLIVTSLLAWFEL